MFVLIFVYGFLNTLFITINAELNKKESSFMEIFGVNQAMDILCYQIVIIISKSFMFWAITNDEKVACWKRTLIFIIALLPYVIIILFNHFYF